MKIDKALPVPLYHQVMSVLEERIITGKWEVGYQLPTETELALQFDVSNITVKRAVHELANKGLLYRQRGKGTFVSPKLKEKDIYSLMTFCAEEEYPHKIVDFSIEEAGNIIANELYVNPSDFVIKMDRLKLDGDTHIGIEHTYLNYKLCPNLSKQSMENEMIYSALEKFNVKLGRAKIYFSSIFAGEYEAEILNIEIGTPLFVLERKTFVENNEIIEFSKFIIRQDHAKYFIEVSL